MYISSIGVGPSLTFYFIYENMLAESKIYYFKLHYIKLYKICLLSHCSFCLKQFDAYVEKVRFFSAQCLKIFLPLQFLRYFYYCFKAAAKTNTIFYYGTKCAGRFVDHKYCLNFLGMVPTFGFRLSIVENVRSPNFIKN